MTDPITEYLKEPTSPKSPVNRWDDEPLSKRKDLTPRVHHSPSLPKRAVHSPLDLHYGPNEQSTQTGFSTSARSVGCTPPLLKRRPNVPDTFITSSSPALRDRTNDCRDDVPVQNDATTFTVKRRKRSQTIVNSNEAKVVAQSVSTKQDSATAVTLPSLDDLSTIRNYIHAYTNLDPDEQYNSFASQQIQFLSNYPLAPPYYSEYGGSPVTARMDKFDIIARLDTKLLEDCRNRDAIAAEEATNCRVERVANKYMYIDKATAVALQPSVYEQRYMTMMKSVGGEISELWKSYFEKLLLNEACEMTKENSKMPARDDNQVQVSTTTTPLDDCAGQQSAAGHDNLNFASDNPVQLPLDQSLTTCSIANDVLMLGFPDRDQPSSDANIANAEAHLFLTLDKALEKYSRTVMEIQRTKKQTCSNNYESESV
jgi:hypothetical protein